jgi:hypothetical protein
MVTTALLNIQLSAALLVAFFKILGIRYLVLKVKDSLLESTIKVLWSYGLTSRVKSLPEHGIGHSSPSLVSLKYKVAFSKLVFFLMKGLD